MTIKQSTHEKSLARSITWNSSKQSYYTARFMVDRPLQEDCYRAYGYFRWADDVIDLECHTKEERLDFIQRQIDLVDRLCGGERPENLSPEENIIADLVGHEAGEACKLRSYVYNFLAILQFDAERKGRWISRKELDWYSDRLGVAVTDAIQHFIGNGQAYPEDEVRYLAANAAHIVHMLRDYVEDIEEGYVNIPAEYLAENNLQPGDIDHPAFRDWVKQRIDLARNYFAQGKRYLDQLDVLRCKLAGYWYCLRFQGVIEAIEGDEYLLRRTYDNRYKFLTLVKFLGTGILVTLRHIFWKSERFLTTTPAELSRANQ